MDSMRKITITDGPLKGKTVEVQTNTERFTTHAGNGHYEVTKDGAKWHRKHTAKASTEKAQEPTRKRVSKTAPNPEQPAPADAPVETTEAQAE